MDTNCKIVTSVLMLHFRMPACRPIKMKWLDHLNASWVGEGSDSIADRDSVAALYSRLITSQELVLMPKTVVHLKGPPLPDFEKEPLTQAEQEHYLNAVLSSQLTLARAICSDSPFASILGKRLIILQRIFHAVASKYHDREGLRQQQKPDEGIVNSSENKATVSHTRSGSDALMEMGVKTGLSLIFSLLRQSWASEGMNLCNDVLQTALNVVCSLPPLSLANETRLPALGLNALSQVSSFLKSMSMPSSGADRHGKQLASELVLALAAQRGSLRYLLEWIEMAMCAASADPSGRNEAGSTREMEAGRMIMYDVFMQILQQMIHSAVCFKNALTGYSISYCIYFYCLIDFKAVFM